MYARLGRPHVPPCCLRLTTAHQLATMVRGERATVALTQWKHIIYRHSRPDLAYILISPL